MGKNILLLYDGSDASVRALGFILTILEGRGKLTILYVIDADRVSDINKSVEREGKGREAVNVIISEIESRTRQQLSEFLRICEKKGIKVRCEFKIGKVTTEILNEAISKKHDLIVLPSGGILEEKIDHILNKVLKSYPGNVLIVK